MLPWQWLPNSIVKVHSTMSLPITTMEKKTLHIIFLPIMFIWSRRSINVLNHYRRKKCRSGVISTTWLKKFYSINQKSQQASLWYTSNETNTDRFTRNRRIHEFAKVWREWKMGLLSGQLLCGMFGRSSNAGTSRNFGYEEHRQQCSNEQHSSSCSAHTILLLVHLNKGSKTCALINNLFTNQFDVIYLTAITRATTINDIKTQKKMRGLCDEGS